MADPTIYSNRQFTAALAVAGSGESLHGPDTFEDLFSAADRGASGRAPADRDGDGEDADSAKGRGAPENNEAIAGIEDPSAENIFASYGFGNDIIFGDDELDYSVLDDGAASDGSANAVFHDEPFDGGFARGFPDEAGDKDASAYITDDDESVA